MMESRRSPYRRRTLLAAIGSVTSAGIAGCLEESDPESTNSSPTDGDQQRRTVGDDTVDQIFVDTRNSMYQQGATVTTSEPSLAWKRDLDVDYYSRIGRGPLLSEDSLFISNNRDILAAISRTDGSVRWRFSETAVDPYTAHRASVARTNGVVATLVLNKRTRDSEVIGIDPETGQKQWAVPIPLDESDDEHATAFKVDGDRAYVGTTTRTDDGVSKLYVVDVANRRVEWHAPLAAGNLYPEDMAIDDGTVFLTTDEAPDDVANVVAFDLESRKRRWDATLPIGEGIPVVDTDHVYLPVKAADGPDSITALSRTDGTVAWRFEQRDAPRTGVTVDDEHVYVVDDNRLYALEPTDGTPTWSFQPDGGPRLAGSSDTLPVVTENLLVTGSWPGDEARIRAIDKASGELVWSYDVPHGTVTSPFVADETLWAIGNDHSDEGPITLYALADQATE
ncbi:PQQ-like beta-propeller repeat protein [Natrinema versiforme]|uniref:PQQ-like beta-propeller repeat protein n=2 Tax=Natrinema versiforme TaxID=88724 RepID=A0A4V1FYG1_9EURY|nr:PQQ-like beta-propeller repeat protein [Natrinema versiforme]